MADAHMPPGVEHTVMREDAVGEHQIVDEHGIDRASGSDGSFRQSCHLLKEEIAPLFQRVRLSRCWIGVQRCCSLWMNAKVSAADIGRS